MRFAQKGAEAEMSGLAALLGAAQALSKVADSIRTDLDAAITQFVDGPTTHTGVAELLAQSVDF